MKACQPKKRPNLFCSSKCTVYFGVRFCSVQTNFSHEIEFFQQFPIKSEQTLKSIDDLHPVFHGGYFL